MNSGSWWWTGRRGELRFMGSQRVGHEWATELNWSWYLLCLFFKVNICWRIDALECCVSVYCTASESALCSHISPLFWISFLLRSPRALSGVSCAPQSSLVLCCIHSVSSVYMSIPTCRFLPPSPPFLLLSVPLFSTSMSLFYRIAHTNFFRFHICALIHTCFSDLLPSVWQSLGPSMFLQMTQSHPFLWLSNIPK